jgi:hypothetical protein
MKIIIETIPHSAQRYSTVGDWQWNDEGDELKIKVSEIHHYNINSLLLIGVHEMIEALLCARQGLTSDDVDVFDLEWTPHSGLIEPGDDPRAPYHREHVFASNIERLIAFYLGFNWQKYEAEIAKLA